VSQLGYDFFTIRRRIVDISAALLNNPQKRFEQQAVMCWLSLCQEAALKLMDKAND
jgi:hypothetical protein